MRPKVRAEGKVIHSFVGLKPIGTSKMYSIKIEKKIIKKDKGNQMSVIHNTILPKPSSQHDVVGGPI